MSTSRPTMTNMARMMTSNGVTGSLLCPIQMLIGAILIALGCESGSPIGKCSKRYVSTGKIGLEVDCLFQRCSWINSTFLVMWREVDEEQQKRRENYGTYILLISLTLHSTKPEVKGRMPKACGTNATAKTLPIFLCDAVLVYTMASYELIWEVQRTVSRYMTE